MSSNRLSESLLQLCESAASKIELPAVSHIYVPPENPRFKKSRKFGLVVLEDESTGFFFNLLNESRPGLPSSMPKDALELARWFLRDDIADRGIGLGAISAITRYCFKKLGYSPDFAKNPMADFEFSADDHIGMVGYFPGLVRELRERGIRLTVLELDQSWVTREDNFEVTLDPARLSGCNKILCTASTLINDTVDQILAHVSQAEQVALVGPSAGCFPDPLFERGIHVVGGSLVRDYNTLVAHCEAETDWEDSVVKFCITASDYPGFDALINRA